MAVYLWHTLCPSFISHICMSHVACHICVTGLVQKSPTKIGHVTYVWCHICVTWLMHKSPSEMGLFHREGVLTDQYVISASVSSRYHQLYQLSPLSCLSTSLTMVCITNLIASLSTSLCITNLIASCNLQGSEGGVSSRYHQLYQRFLSSSLLPSLSPTWYRIAREAY